MFVVVMQLYIVGKEIKIFFEQSRSVFVINVVFRSVVFFLQIRRTKCLAYFSRLQKKVKMIFTMATTMTAFQLITKLSSMNCL